MYTDAMDALSFGKTADTDRLREDKEILMRQNEKLRKGHMERVGKGKCDAALTVSYSALLHNIDRMGNSCVNLAEATLRNVDFSNFLDDGLNAVI